MLTKKQRNALYKEALNYMKRNPQAGVPGVFYSGAGENTSEGGIPLGCPISVGICGILWVLQEKMYPNTVEENRLYNEEWTKGFPELWGQRPPNNEYDIFWFNSREERMEVLEKCVSGSERRKRGAK